MQPKHPLVLFVANAAKRFDADAVALPQRVVPSSLAQLYYLGLTPSSVVAKSVPCLAAPAF